MQDTNSSNSLTDREKLIDRQAERAVIASCLIDERAITKIAPKLTATDFHWEAHQVAYAAMLRLSERNVPVDTISLASELQSAGQLEIVGGYAGISEISEGTPTALYVEHYASIVSFCSLRRRAEAAAQKIAGIAYSEAETEAEIIDLVEAAAMAVSSKSRDGELQSIQFSVKSLMDRISFLANNPTRLVGVPTGFTMLDKILGGLHKGSMYTIAGRPGMGKTAAAITIAHNAADKYGAKVAIFSLEMSKEELTNRLLSMSTSIDSHRLQMGQLYEDEWPILMEAANELSQVPIYIDDTPGASVTAIRTKARRMHAEHGLDLIVIDYLQLMMGNSSKGKQAENRQQEITQISMAIKNLARELDIPIIALSQLSRAVEQRADKRPMLSDLRESGSIEQDSDVVMFIYREDYYDEDTEKQNIADIIVAKHRHGSTGTVSLFFRKELTQFVNLEVTRTELNDY
jgi:replicative DNA helicase